MTKVIVNLGHFVPNLMELLVRLGVSVSTLGVAGSAERAHVPYVVLTTSASWQDMVTIHQRETVVRLCV